MAKPSGGSGGPRDEPDYSDIKKRLDKLGGKLDSVHGRAPPPDSGDAGARGKAMSFAFRLASELIGGVVVGGLIGWGLDRLLGTAPILLIVCLLLGVAGGLLNSVRAAQRMQKDLQGDR
jgi:ATP synthase protein I